MQKENLDELFMRRCIQLAENGKPTTAPNPMVGAVIVCNRKIIGEGYHIRAGEPHAEINALRSVADRSLLPRSTMYVSLEPCSHYGKTPPCADTIIREKIQRVVIGCEDPFAKVRGNGIRKLREAGIDVQVGVLEQECIALNQVFITFHALKRPYVTLKWAESADGFIDKERESGTPQVLSTSLTRMLAHKLRAEHQAILVGSRTALLDNPSLNVRHWTGKNPLRIVINRTNSLPENLRLFDGAVPTLIVTEAGCERAHVEILPASFETPLVPQILSDLHKKGIQSVLIEGGSYTHRSFIESGMWDEAYIEKSVLQLHRGVTAPRIQGVEKVYSRFGVSYAHYLNPCKTVLHDIFYTNP